MTHWVQFMEERRWKPGTVLRIQSDVPLVFHFAMVEFLNLHSGLESAIHNTPDTGVAWAFLDEVAGTRPVEVYWEPQTPEQGIAAIMRMRSLIGMPYDLIEANCEHVMRWAVTGEWRSEQVCVVKAALLVAGAVAVAAALQRRR